MKPHKGLKDIIEHRLETPVFMIVGVMMVIRAAQVFSGGALKMSQWLGPVWFPRFEVATGLGLGLGSEMLMTLAGRSWRNWQAQGAEIASRSGLSKIQRTSYVNEARQNARNSFWFMLVGAAASLYTGISFLLSNGGDAFQDTMACVVITAVVLYLGVFRETGGQDETQAALAELDAGMNDALAAAIDRFKRGASTDQDNQFIAEHLPQHRQAKFRRSVAKANKGRMWKASQIREALGLGNDARLIRDLNRQVNALAKTAENGLAKAEDGRTWLLPHAVVMDTWGEQMAEYAAMRKIGTMSTPGSTSVSQPAESAGQRIGQGEMSQPAMLALVPVSDRTGTDTASMEV